MKISLKVEYACRVLAQLGRRYGTGQLAHIDELAEAEEVPANYLVQILNELRNGGLINSRRGKQGGYALAFRPADITLYQIIRVVDSEILDGRLSEAGQSGPRLARVWGNLSAKFEAFLKATTLEHLMARDGAEMYYI